MQAGEPRAAPTSDTDRLVGLVLDTALDAVVVMGADGMILDWNAQAQGAFGWTRDEAVGQVLAELVIPEEFRQAHREGLSHFLATGEGPVLRRRIEVSALHKSGAEFPIELSIQPIGPSDAPIFLGFVRDISERKHGEALLWRQAREAELLNEVTMLAGETGSLEEVLPACLAAICELTGWPAGHAFLPNRANPPRLASSRIWHGDTEAFASLRAITDTLTLGPGEAMPGRIWRRRQPYWLVDDGGEARINEFPRARMTRALGLKATFGFPLIIGGEVAAVVEFFSRDPTPPDARLKLMVRTIGEQVGRVLERRRVQEHQALLLAELDHRAMNMLAVVMGLADQTARRAESLTSFRADFAARLISLARGYSLLTAKGWRPTQLSEIVRQIVQPYLADGEAQLDLIGPEILLPPKAGMALSMVLHELAANATKYGALSVPSGRLSVSAAILASSDANSVELVWREMGLTGVKPPVRQGFGSKLIEASIRRELGGTLDVDFAPEGVRYRFEFPQPTI